MTRALADPRRGDGIGVVVVTYDSASTIDECLQRLRVAEGVTAIRVIDNNSQDDTLAVVQRHAVVDARVRFIGNPDNPGFGVACNQGARECATAWLAFVNPDCLVEADTLLRLREFATPLGNAVLGADLVDDMDVRDPAARRRDPDFGAMLAGAFMRSRRQPLHLPPDDTRPLQYVDAISGALMLMPHALFDRIGGFDEAYRLHAEDLDLCRRARQAGATVAVANAVRVVHVRGVSSRSKPVFVEWHKHRGLWRYFRRFEAAQRPWPVQIGVFAAIWLRFPLAVLRAAWRWMRP